jgi:hypothetical protein
MLTRLAKYVSRRPIENELALMPQVALLATAGAARLGRLSGAFPN